ncbi:MAG: 3-phosphoshikimate 1-carboxyvinyltransferase [candidate division Zixibacteria bacterium]
MDKVINPITKLRATITLSGDTAISHRVAIVSAICKNTVKVENFALGHECMTTLECLSRLGVEWELEGTTLTVHGKGIGGLTKPNGPLDVGNSVPTARLICGLLATADFESELVCGEAICNLPMRRVIEPLSKMGAEFESNNHRMPLKIKGAKLSGIHYAMPVSSSQVKGTLLLAGLLAEGKTEIIERIPSRDHTERLLAYFGVRLKKSRVEPKPSDEDPLIKRFKKETGNVSPDIKGDMYAIQGGQVIQPKPLKIPGDISAAAHFIVAGLLVKDAVVKVENVSLNNTRLGFADVLEKMRAPITVENKGEFGFEPHGTIEIKSAQIKGRRMVGELIPSIIDELPVMSIVAASAQGTSVIRDAYELRNQKVDRIKSISSNLRKMGVKVGELDDGMAIDGTPTLEGAEIDSFGDYRIAMAFAIAGLIAEGPTVIKDAECVDAICPGFWDEIDRITSS